MERKLATEIMKYDDYLAYFERSKSSDFIILYQMWVFVCACTFAWCPIAFASGVGWTKQTSQKMSRMRQRDGESGKDEDVMYIHLILYIT